MNKQGTGSTINFCFFLAIAVSFTACTNNTLRGLNKSSKFKNPVIDDSESNDPDAPFFQIKTVVRSTFDPNKTFDIIGDGSGFVGSVCLPPPNDDGVTPEGSACICHFEFTKREGSNESFEAPVTYFESNLLRCSFFGIPGDVPVVNVSVRINNSDGFSNEIPFALQGAGTTGDPTSAFNFLRVQRYLCKDAVFIPNLMDASGGNPTPVYDPFLSESPEISYGLNFFTSNMGGTLIQFVEKSIPTNGVGFICPTAAEGNLDGTDKRIFSLGPDQNNSRVIFPIPQAGSGIFDRSTFYLAKAPVGVFKVPFNTFIAPNIFTEVNSKKNNDGSQPGPIGFGAPPFRLSDKEEVCQDSTAIIPNGMQWVKVWQFRSTLEARTIKVSPHLASIGLFCNPGLFSDGTPKAAACNSIDFTKRLDSAARCFNVHAGRANSTLGTDFWDLTGSLSSCSDIGDDPLSICPARPTTLNTIPQNRNVVINNIDQASRFDLLYVVTPPDIMTNDFQQQNAKALPYLPYRFYSADHCLSRSGVENTLNGKKDCEAKNRIPYGFVTQDASQVDPDSNRPASFPLCVLQPK